MNLRWRLEEWAAARADMFVHLGWPEESKMKHHQRYGPIPPPKKGKRKPTSVQEIHADRYARVLSVEQAFQELPEVYQNVCLVYFVADNSVRATAAELSMSKDRVMTALHFITGFMTAMLKGQGRGLTRPDSMLERDYGARSDHRISQSAP